MDLIEFANIFFVHENSGGFLGGKWKGVYGKFAKMFVEFAFD